MMGVLPLWVTAHVGLYCHVTTSCCAPSCLPHIPPPRDHALIVRRFDALAHYGMRWSILRNWWFFDTFPTSERAVVYDFPDLPPRYKLPLVGNSKLLCRMSTEYAYLSANVTAV
eukprot:155105-Rhodomonas_salina.2